MNCFNYFIGIDVSKATLDVALVKDGKQVFYEKLDNKPQAIKQLLKRLLKQCGDLSQILFCMECTGVYNNHLLQILGDEQLSIWMESAIQIKRSMGIQRGKNDKADSTFSIGDSTVFDASLTVGQTYLLKLNLLSNYDSNFEACLIVKSNYEGYFYFTDQNGNVDSCYYSTNGIGISDSVYHYIHSCQELNYCIDDTICISMSKWDVGDQSYHYPEDFDFEQVFGNQFGSVTYNSNHTEVCITFNSLGTSTIYAYPDYSGNSNFTSNILSFVSGSINQWLWSGDCEAYMNINVYDQTPPATPNQNSTICLGGSYTLTTFPGTVLTNVTLDNVSQPIPDPAFWSTTLPGGQHIINYTVDGLCQPASYSDTIIIIDTTDVSMTIDACNHATFTFQTCDVFTTLEFSDGLGGLFPITPVNGFATWTVDYSNISSPVTWTFNGWQQTQTSPPAYGIVFTESQTISPAVPSPITTNAPSHLCDLTASGISITGPSGLQNIVWATSPATATFTGQGTTTIFPNSWSTTAGNVTVIVTAVDSNGCHYSDTMVLQVCCVPDADGTEFFERTYVNNAQLQSITNQLPAGYYNGPTIPIAINLPAPQPLTSQISTIYSAPTTLTSFISANPSLFTTGSLQSNQWIFFNHDLIVNTNLTINNTNFIRFAPGKRMLIQPGYSVTINSSTIAAKCDSMWGGIHIPDATASLTVRNSNLIAAVKAIHSENGGYYKVTSSNLIDNYASIWVENYTTLPTTSIAEANYFGDVINQNLMAPYNNEAQPVYGFYIEKIKDIVVGPQTTASLGNLIHNHKRGINSLVSTTHVFRNTFFNIKRQTGTPSGQDYAAIFANGNSFLSNFTLEVGNAVLTRNIFMNCETGVISNKFMHLSAKNNYMKGCLLRGISTQDNRLKNITIWNNEINSVNPNALAIYVKNYQLGTTNIQYNYINANNPQPLAQPRFGAGIYVANELGIATNQNTLINNNYIHNSIYGIWVLQISSAVVENNQVFYDLNNAQTNTLATVQKLRGILIQNSPKSEVNSNEITKTIGANIVSVPNDNLQGIRLEFSPASNIRKNIMTKTPVGFYAKGSSLGSHVDCNKMFSTRNGFVMDLADLSNQGAPVGDITYPNGYISNNEWFGTLSEKTEGSVANPMLYYHSQGGIFESNPSTGLSATWFDIQINTNPNTINHCNLAIMPNILAESPLNKRKRQILPIAQNSINYSILDYEQKHYLKLSAYSRLIQDTTLINLGDTTDLVIEEFIDSNNVLNSQTKILYDIQVAILQDDYQMALNLNGLLSSTCNQYSTNKSVQELMITRLMNNQDFSAQDSAFLLGVACLDPLEFGSGVYQARALMDWNGECSESNNKSIAIEESENDMKTEAFLYPNPNNGKFKLTADSEISSIKFFNLNGIEIKEFISIKSSEFEFNLSLYPGIYLVKITLIQGGVIDKRLIIE